MRLKILISNAAFISLDFRLTSVTYISEKGRYYVFKLYNTYSLYKQKNTTDIEVIILIANKRTIKKTIKFNRYKIKNNIRV